MLVHRQMQGQKRLAGCSNRRVHAVSCRNVKRRQSHFRLGKGTVQEEMWVAATDQALACLPWIIDATLPVADLREYACG